MMTTMMMLLLMMMMCSELLARIVQLFSTCLVVPHLLSPLPIYPRGCLSFCSLRVGSRPHQMRPHVGPPSVQLSQVPSAHPLHQAHSMHLSLLSECDRLSVRHPFLAPCSSLSYFLPRRLYLFMYASLLFPSTFAQ